jgi:hypothetical protein
LSYPVKYLPYQKRFKIEFVDLNEIYILYHYIQISAEAHPASYAVGIWNSRSGWIMKLSPTSIYGWG